MKNQIEVNGMKLTGILLPTEDASILALLHNELVSVKGKNGLFEKAGNCIAQHLYLCSTLPIKGHCYYTDGKHIYKNTIDLDGYIGFYRIEFTIDPKLHSKCKQPESCGSSLSKKCVCPKDGVPAIDGNTKAYVEYKKYIYTDRNKYELGLLEINFLSEYCKRYNNNQKDNQKGVDVENPIEKLMNELKETEKNCLPEFKNGIQHSILRASAYLYEHNQALQSNAGGFSLEDIKKAITLARQGCVDFDEVEDDAPYYTFEHTPEQVIQSLTKEQPKGDIVIECEMEVVRPKNYPVETTYPLEIKLDSNGQPTLTFK